MRNALIVFALFILAGCEPFVAVSPGTSSARLAAEIRADGTLRGTLAAARELVTAGGLNAGGHYPQTWVRDLATFLPLYLQSGGNRGQVRQALLSILAFQQPDGDIPDGVVTAQDAQTNSHTSPLAPGMTAFTNSVETDQASSLVQAVTIYVRATKDQGFLNVAVGKLTVLDRLDAALRHVLVDRTDANTGLVWSGATIDWGDVEAGSSHPNTMGPWSHRAIGIYTNAMFSEALLDYVSLPGVDATYWRRRRVSLNASIQGHLWDAREGKYRAHLYLNGSPFPREFNEDRVVVHGGTAVAILAGLLSPADVRRSLVRMDADVVAAHASSIGLTVWPIYPANLFTGAGGPNQYQDGGDWDWFGARWVQALIANGYVMDAYREFKPMEARVKRAGGYYEWWDLQGHPHGSMGFRGAAGEDGLAAIELQDWAANQH